MKFYYLLAFGLVLFTLIYIGYKTKPSTFHVPQSQINTYAEQIRHLLEDKYNSDIIFYVDLTKPSNNYRFFVIDLKTNKVLTAGLACNGKTNKDGSVIYSNEPGSNSSSKGLYCIGASYTGQHGKAYRLYGLNSTNSNALRR
ncbi:hypothetical protein ADIARSV_3798 [Arcticibacter svalbardensis MN12-7]|uniref:Uncharacterized protein n=1 Tax=Arcticibacter svalbardensis MN12-7 TaxID=1150600 RepID=R9GMH8_9SPHI|nr:murein L,D-transpeptidase catalytic domain family protein [Arcticibacter svalbardensis]EOR93042.1 hypothetical protein ADIARSV_3798 [Arcticibacter svalbardensis MN12-7]